MAHYSTAMVGYAGITAGTAAADWALAAKVRALAISGVCDRSGLDLSRPTLTAQRLR